MDDSEFGADDGDARERDMIADALDASQMDPRRYVMMMNEMLVDD